MASTPESPAKPIRERRVVLPLFADRAAPAVPGAASPVGDAAVAPAPRAQPCDAAARPVAEQAPRAAAAPLRVMGPKLPDMAAGARVQYAPGVMVFDDGKESVVERLKRAAVAAFPQLPTRQLALLDDAIRELLPPDAGRLAGWGDTLLRATEAITSELQRLTAAVVGWRAGEVIEDCHQAMGASGLWRMLRRSPGSLKPALELIVEQATPTLAALDRLATRLAPCRDRYAASLLLQKVAPDVLALPVVEAETLTRRSHLLALSAQQFELLEPQLERLRVQVIAWQNEIEQLLRVTIPVWELANARGVR